ncbi:MAG: hypothetical protein ACREJC_19975 [Tepidisphaeraceae bacterium]
MQQPFDLPPLAYATRPVLPLLPNSRLRVLVVLLAFGVLTPAIVSVTWLLTRHPVGYGAPSIAAPIPGAPGPYDARLAAAYRKYMELEGPSHRATLFQACAMSLNMRMVPQNGAAAKTVTELEMMFYLGPPDLIANSSGQPGYVYAYDGKGTKDSAIYITVGTVAGQRVITQMGWSTMLTNGGGSYQPYSAPASAPTTQAVQR